MEEHDSSRKKKRSGADAMEEDASVVVPVVPPAGKSHAHVIVLLTHSSICLSLLSAHNRQGSSYASKDGLGW